MNNVFKQGDWDKTGSTYKQIIVFSSGKVLVGFSKRMGFHERNDKIDLLTNWILRMYRDGYLEKNNQNKTDIDRIEYYINFRGQHLMNLYYKYPEYMLDDLIIENEYKKLVIFLKKFYDMIDKGIQADEIYRKLYTKNRSSSATHDHLSLDKKRFDTLEHLRRYANDLKLERIRPPGEVDHFVIKYCEKFFGFTPDI